MRPGPFAHPSDTVIGQVCRDRLSNVRPPQPPQAYDSEQNPKGCNAEDEA